MIKRDYPYNCYKILLIVMAIIILASIGAYCMSPAIDSDMVEGLFWAEAAISGNGLLNSQFVYSYAIPFGANVLLTPFVKLFGMTQLANSLGMLVFYLLMVATSFLLLKELGIRNQIAAVGTAVMMLAFRSQMGVNLLHHILYYQLGFVCFNGLMAAALHIMNSTKGTVSKRWYCCLVLFAVWCGANGIPTILLSGVPAAVALCITSLCKKTSGKVTIAIAGLVLCGVLTGYGIYKLSLHGIQESNYLKNVGAYSLASSEKWIDNLTALPKLWLELFLVDNPEGVNFTSLIGIETLFSVFLALVSAMIPFYYLIRIQKMDSTEMLIFCGCIVIWGVCLIQYIFIRQTPQARLLYNGLCVNFILLALFVCRMKPRLREHNGLILLFAGILSFYSIFFSANANWSYESLDASELEKKGLGYGLTSSYWCANINTVNTKGRVKIRYVNLNNGVISPVYYQSNYTWYESPSEEGLWFLLITDEEYKNLHSATNTTLLDSCLEVISLRGNYADPNMSARNAYNEFQVNQEYKALVYSSDIWEDCVLKPKQYVYDLSSTTWTTGCEYIMSAKQIENVR